MEVTVTLKDAQNNPVAGQGSLLTVGAVTVPNSTGTASWTDNLDGTYTANYTAATARTGLTASLQVTDWGDTVQSPDYEITAGAPDLVNSTFVSSKTRIVGNDYESAELTLTLYDEYNNLITGAADDLAVDSSIEGVTVSVFAEVQGVYTARITAKDMGSVTLTALLNSIKASDDEPRMSVYGYQFSLNTDDVKLLTRGTYSFIVVATPSDGGDRPEQLTSVSWNSSNSSVGSVDNSGLFTANRIRGTNVSGSGEFKSFQFSSSVKVSVVAPQYSKFYGSYQASDAYDEYIVEQPSYELAARDGDAIDAIGTLEGLSGGSGGVSSIIKNIDQISEIEVFTGGFKFDDTAGMVIGLRFTYKDGYE